jgi:hypothetical protein
MTQGSEKDYRANNIAMIILRANKRASKGDDRGTAPPMFLLLARTGHGGSILLDHLCQQRASFSRFIVALQQVWEKNEMRF